MAGQKVPSARVIRETEQYILSEYWQKCYEKNETIINDITTVGESDELTYQWMKKQGVLSCIHILFTDKAGEECILALEAVSKKIVWNKQHLHYFRLMAKLLGEYELNK